PRWLSITSRTASASKDGLAREVHRDLQVLRHPFETGLPGGLSVLLTGKGRGREMPQFLAPRFQLLVGLLASRLQGTLDAINASNHDPAFGPLLQLQMQAHPLPLAICTGLPRLLRLHEGGFGGSAGFGNPTNPEHPSLVEREHVCRALHPTIGHVDGLLVWL